jgi:rhodanese-related sulfurtransferase
MQLETEKQFEHQGGLASLTAEATVKTPEELSRIVVRFAASGGWIDRVRLRAGHRWYERLHYGADYDIWAISWLPGQSTGYHDHGDSAGAFVVATGVLEEHRPGEQPLEIQAGLPRAFGLDYAHDVRNASIAPAISIHAYSPPLDEMNEYELDGSELVPRERATERAQTLQVNKQLKEEEAATHALAADSLTSNLSGIDQMLARARARLRRLSPLEAHEAAANGRAILVDIRPESQRAAEGGIDGALLIERNVLEWRLDPASTARLPIATDHDIQVIVFCSEGYTSSLAAASLHDLGLWRATDIAGGFNSWRAVGLPCVAPIVQP